MVKRIGNKMTYWKQVIVVEGSGQFPFDMLRYDDCIPRHESEMHKLDFKMWDPTSREKRRIELTRFSANGEPPTEERWRSFGWRVVEVK